MARSKTILGVVALALVNFILQTDALPRIFKKKTECDFCLFMEETGKSPYKQLWSLSNLVTYLSTVEMKNLLLDSDQLADAEAAFLLFCDATCDGSERKFTVPPIASTSAVASSGYINSDGSSLNYYIPDILKRGNVAVSVSGNEDALGWINDSHKTPDDGKGGIQMSPPQSKAPEDSLSRPGESAASGYASEPSGTSGYITNAAGTEKSTEGAKPDIIQTPDEKINSSRGGSAASGSATNGDPGKENTTEEPSAKGSQPGSSSQNLNSKDSSTGETPELKGTGSVSAGVVSSPNPSLESAPTTVASPLANEAQDSMKESTKGNSTPLETSSAATSSAVSSPETSKLSQQPITSEGTPQLRMLQTVFSVEEHKRPGGELSMRAYPIDDYSEETMKVSTVTANKPRKIANLTSQEIPKRSNQSESEPFVKKLQRNGGSKEQFDNIPLLKRSASSGMSFNNGENFSAEELGEVGRGTAAQMEQKGTSTLKSNWPTRTQLSAGSNKNHQKESSVSFKDGFSAAKSSASGSRSHRRRNRKFVKIMRSHCDVDFCNRFREEKCCRHLQI